MTVKGKVAIVTGGNSGIGLAIVLELAKQGANIVIDYVAHPEATEALEKQVHALGDQAIGVQADVSKVADLQRLIATASRGSAASTSWSTTPGLRRAHPCSTRPRRITKRYSPSISRARFSAPSSPRSR